MNVINEVGAMPTPQHARKCSFEGAAQDLRGGDAGAPRRRRQAQPHHQRRLLRLHHRLRPDLHRRQGTLHGREQGRSTGATPGGSSTKRRGPWEAIPESTISIASPTSTSSATRTAWTPISFGATVAAAMELYETGAIDNETTGGIELRLRLRPRRWPGSTELTAREARASGSTWGSARSACARSMGGRNCR